MVDNCRKMGLQATEWYLKKIIQVSNKVSHEKKIPEKLTLIEVS